MAWPASEIVKRVAPHVPELLVSPAAMDRVRLLSRQIPTGWSSYYIECRLADGADQADLLAGVGLADGAVVHDSLDSALEGGTLSYGPLWWRFANLCAGWREKNAELAAHVPALWVELDHAGTAPMDAIAPNFCVCVARDYLSPTVLGSDGAGARSVLERSLKTLLPGGVDPDTRDRLEHVLDAGITGARVIYLSVMLGRSPATLKLYLEVARDQLPNLGRALQCPTALDEVSELVHELAPELATIYLDLTVSAPLDHRVGFAFSQFHLRDAPHLTPSWDGVLDRLVRRGACSPAKRATLASWPGRELIRFEGESWPVHLIRYLDLKVVVERGCTPMTKAYLGFMPKAAFL